MGSALEGEVSDCKKKRNGMELRRRSEGFILYVASSYVLRPLESTAPHYCPSLHGSWRNLGGSLHALKQCIFNHVELAVAECLSLTPRSHRLCFNCWEKCVVT